MITGTLTTTGTSTLCDTRTKKRTLDEECEVGVLACSLYILETAPAFCSCRCGTRCRLARPTSQPSSNGGFSTLVSQSTISALLLCEVYVFDIFNVVDLLYHKVLKFCSNKTLCSLSTISADFLKFRKMINSLLSSVKIYYKFSLHFKDTLKERLITDGASSHVREI